MELIPLCFPFSLTVYIGLMPCLSLEGGLILEWNFFQRCYLCLSLSLCGYPSSLLCSYRLPVVQDLPRYVCIPKGAQSASRGGLNGSQTLRQHTLVCEYFPSGRTGKWTCLLRLCCEPWGDSQFKTFFFFAIIPLNPWTQGPQVMPDLWGAIKKPQGPDVGISAFLRDTSSTEWGWEPALGGPTGLPELWRGGLSAPQATAINRANSLLS